jgi:hypothetical protein
MNKKALRYAFSEVLDAAETLTCKDLPHKEKDKHDPEYFCPVEYRLARSIHIVREYAASASAAMSKPEGRV